MRTHTPIQVISYKWGPLHKTHMWRPPFRHNLEQILKHDWIELIMHNLYNMLVVSYEAKLLHLMKKVRTILVTLTYFSLDLGTVQTGSIS